MARKNNRPKPGPDGYLLTGIYKKYVGKPKPEHQLTFENAKVAAAELDTPVGDNLARIRAWLSKFILPHIDGPLSEQESRQWVGHFYGLDFGDGVATYREKATLNTQEQCVIDAFHDGVEALNQIRLVELHAGDDGKPNWFFRASFQLGQLCGRIPVRFSEPLVLAEKGRREGAPKGAHKANEVKAAKRPDFKSLVDNAMSRCSSYQQAVEQVAAATGKSDRTVRKHAPNPAPQNRGRWKKGRKHAK